MSIRLLQLVDFALEAVLTTVEIRIHTKPKIIRPDIKKSNSLWIVEQSKA